MRSPFAMALRRIRAAIPDLRADAELWRRAARFGAVHGPEAFVRWSPPIIGVAWAAALPKAREQVARALRASGARGTSFEVAAVFATYASSLTEAFEVGSGRSSRLQARILGDAHFAAARADGRGVIVATAHTSGWYASGPILRSVYDDDVVTVMRAERDERAQRVQAAQRDELGLKVVYVGGDPLSALPLLRHLRNGGVVALQMDRVPSGLRGIETTLGGQPFSIPEGPLALSALSGAPIVVVLGRRVGTLTYEITVSPRIDLPRRPTPSELAHAAENVATQIGTYVKRHPTDWFHFDPPAVDRRGP